jgi:hypothetical protein
MWDTTVARLAVTLISWQATAAFPDTTGASPDTTAALPDTTAASPNTTGALPHTTGASLDRTAAIARAHDGPHGSTKLSQLISAPLPKLLGKPKKEPASL